MSSSVTPVALRSDRCGDRSKPFLIRSDRMEDSISFQKKSPQIWGLCGFLVSAGYDLARASAPDTCPFVRAIMMRSKIARLNTSITILTLFDRKGTLAEWECQCQYFCQGPSHGFASHGFASHGFASLTSWAASLRPGFASLTSWIRCAHVLGSLRSHPGFRSAEHPGSPNSPGSFRRHLGSPLAMWKPSDRFKQKTPGRCVQIAPAQQDQDMSAANPGREALSPRTRSPFA
jgi:hypothetical protein